MISFKFNFQANKTIVPFPSICQTRTDLIQFIISILNNFKNDQACHVIWGLKFFSKIFKFFKPFFTIRTLMTREVLQKVWRCWICFWWEFLKQISRKTFIKKIHRGWKSRGRAWNVFFQKFWLRDSLCFKKLKAGTNFLFL